MHLSPEDIAAAEACGVSFLAASDAQVQRLAMQRKIFYRAGAPILATRGDGFFETVGTLQQLIEESHRQQRDLSQWLEAAKPAAEAAPEPDVARAAPEPATAGEAAPPEPIASGDALPPLQAEPEVVPPKRPRQRRRRPETVTEHVAEAPQETAVEERVAVPLPSGPSRSRGRAARAPAVVAETPGQDRGKRWLMAGAARRGRAGKHWSTRQR